MTPLTRRLLPCTLLCAVTLLTSVGAQLSPEDAGLLPPPGTVVEPARWAGRLDVPGRITGHLEFLASDELGGRDTATLQGEITSRYVASVLSAAGLQPAGDDGGFLQTYPLERNTLDMESMSLTLVDAQGEVRRAFEPVEDFALRGYSSVGFDVAAPVVFAGHGIVDTDEGVDDYAGLDVDGKLVLVLDGQPAGHAELRSSADWRAKRDEAQDRGATGLLIVSNPESRMSAGIMRYVRRLMTHGAMSLGGDMAALEGVFPRAYVEPVVAEILFRAAGLDFADAFEERSDTAGLGGYALGDVRLHLFAEVHSEALSASNVAGLLPGTDPELADEVIVMTAHMDHVGIGEDGAVYNGADDNASGTAALMATAEVLASRGAPRRSVLFLAVSGEEKGLLGSKWWVAHPTVPIESVVANLNVDMVGRNDPDGLGVTPSPDHDEYNSLVEAAIELGPESGLEVGFTAGEGKFERRVDVYYERSDHANFARAGIPVAFFFSGEHEDYHKPTDTLEKVDRTKVWRVVDLMARLIERVGSADQRPYRLNE